MEEEGTGTRKEILLILYIMTNRYHVHVHHRKFVTNQVRDKTVAPCMDH